MRPLCLTIIGLWLAFASLSSAAAAAGEPGYGHVQRDEGLSYLLRLPEDYRQTDRRYPLLLFFHGIAQKGNGSAEAIERVAADGPFRAMRDGVWDDALPLIVAGPQVGGLQPWWPRVEAVAVLEHLMTDYRVDPARVYLSGISMGGRVVWWLVEEMPERFAAVVPTSTWAGDLSESCAGLSHLGVWAFHGAKDPLIWAYRGRRPVETLENCEPPPLHAPHFTVIADAGHGRWQRVYGNAHADRNLGADGREYRDIYRWLLSYALASNPSSAD